jgi:CRISPR-associated protein Cas5t
MGGGFLLKILKMKLFQETACYKKPFAFKVAETYPLPPYSTVIGMFHKIIGAKPGEYYPMNISIQGDYESIFSNYQNLRMFKRKGKVTQMPRNVHQLLNVNLIIHMQAEDETVEKIYNNVISGKESFTLGRNEDLVRVDEIKIIDKPKEVRDKFINNHNAYIPVKYTDEYVNGINYRLNSVYTIKNELRNWEKINVKYIEKHTNESILETLQDEDGDYIFWYK